MFGTMDQTSYGLINQNDTNTILTAIYKKMMLKWSQWKWMSGFDLKFSKMISDFPQQE